MSEDFGRIPSSDLIAVATIIVGFGVTVIMFRVQRELWVRDKHPDWPNWLAWADWLILVSVALAVFFVVTPLLAFPIVTKWREALAAGSSVSAILLQVGYIPAILAHYRIEVGTQRTGAREKGRARRKVFLHAVLRTRLPRVRFCLLPTPDVVAKAH